MMRSGPGLGMILCHPKKLHLPVLATPCHTSTKLRKTSNASAPFIQLFGVRPEFGPSDFVVVLAQITEETVQGDENSVIGCDNDREEPESK